MERIDSMENINIILRGFLDKKIKERIKEIILNIAHSPRRYKEQTITYAKRNSIMELMNTEYTTTINNSKYYIIDILKFKGYTDYNIGLSVLYDSISNNYGDIILAILHKENLDGTMTRLSKPLERHFMRDTFFKKDNNYNKEYLDKIVDELFNGLLNNDQNKNYLHEFYSIPYLMEIYLNELRLKRVVVPENVEIEVQNAIKNHVRWAWVEKIRKMKDKVDDELTNKENQQERIFDSIDKIELSLIQLQQNYDNYVKKMMNVHTKMAKNRASYTGYSGTAPAEDRARLEIARSNEAFRLDNGKKSLVNKNKEADEISQEIKTLNNQYKNLKTYMIEKIKETETDITNAKEVLKEEKIIDDYNSDINVLNSILDYIITQDKLEKLIKADSQYQNGVNYNESRLDIDINFAIFNARKAKKKLENMGIYNDFIMKYPQLKKVKLSLKLLNNMIKLSPESQKQPIMSRKIQHFIPSAKKIVKTFISGGKKRKKSHKKKRSRKQQSRKRRKSHIRKSHRKRR